MKIELHFIGMTAALRYIIVDPLKQSLFLCSLVKITNTSISKQVWIIHPLEFARY